LSCGNIVRLEPSWMLCLFGQNILGFQTVMTTLNVLLIYILLLWVFAVPLCSHWDRLRLVFSFSSDYQ